MLGTEAKRDQLISLGFIRETAEMRADTQLRKWPTLLAFLLSGTQDVLATRNNKQELRRKS